jgi:pantothenate synthetase
MVEDLNFEVDIKIARLSVNLSSCALKRNEYLSDEDRQRAVQSAFLRV